MKSKQAADAILAKGLSSGGRRHEVERFWERGEDGICLRCCGRDHFGKCIGEAKCLVCAGEHEGSEHKCAAEGCSKKSEPCEHHAAKCANCQGPHLAISKRCPERRFGRPTRVRNPTEMRSSPPRIETEIDLAAAGDQAEMDLTQPEVDRTTPVHVVSSSPDNSTSPLSVNPAADISQIRNRDQSLPRMVKELRTLIKTLQGQRSPTAAATRHTYQLKMIVPQHKCNGTAVSTVASLEAAIERGAGVVLARALRRQKVHDQPPEVPDTMARMREA